MLVAHKLYLDLAKARQLALTIYDLRTTIHEIYGN